METDCECACCFRDLDALEGIVVILHSQTQKHEILKTMPQASPRRPASTYALKRGEDVNPKPIFAVSDGTGQVAKMIAETLGLRLDGVYLTPQVPAMILKLLEKQHIGALLNAPWGGDYPDLPKSLN